MLEKINEKCEKFLDWISYKVEPVCKNMVKYPSLSVCVIMFFVVMLILFVVFV